MSSEIVAAWSNLESVYRPCRYNISGFTLYIKIPIEVGFGATVGNPCKISIPSQTLLYLCRSAVKTIIKIIEDPEGAYTEVIVKTTDRPGLLTDIVHNMKDINVNVISAEVQQPIEEYALITNNILPRLMLAVCFHCTECAAYSIWLGLDAATAE